MRFRDVRRLLRDERGAALVMAIGVAMVLAIAGTSLIAYGTSNERAADRSKRSHDSYQTSVAGIENAVSQLASATAAQRGDYALFGAMSPSGKTQAFGVGESVAWDGALWDDNPNNATNPGGSALYTGSPSDNYIPNLRWRLTSTSVVPAESGPGTITRTVTSDVRLRPLTQQTRDEQSWEYVYSWKTGDPCDMTLPNNPSVQSSFYVAGNLCLDNNSSIVGPQFASDPPVKVNVRGNMELMKNGNDVGTNARPLTSLFVEGALGCKYRSNPWNYWCTDGPPPPGDHVVPDSQRGSPAIPRPVAQFDDWYYVASPGPSQPCDPALSTGAYPDFTDNDAALNGSKGTLALPSYGAFSCKTLLGELTWNPSTNRIVVDGTIMWDGNLEFDTANANITYDGIAAFYVSGWFRMRQTRLCAALTGSNCNYASWNTDQDVLFVAAGGWNNWSQCTQCGVLLESSAQFQGALYSDYNMGFQNNSFVQGPMVAKMELIQNSFTFNYIPPNIRVPFGTPSNTIVGWNILPPTNFTG